MHFHHANIPTIAVHAMWRMDPFRGFFFLFFIFGSSKNSFIFLYRYMLLTAKKKKKWPSNRSWHIKRADNTSTGEHCSHCMVLDQVHIYHRVFSPGCRRAHHCLVSSTPKTYFRGQFLVEFFCVLNSWYLRYGKGQEGRPDAMKLQ